MISHVFLGTNDFGRALAFYRPLMAALGHRERFCEPSRPWAAWEPSPGARPLFVIGRPFDGEAAAAGNGQMTALLAPDRATVDRLHALALSLGGADEGAPGLRPHYHPHYYGAYFRDPDGHKLCVVCHRPEPA
ncbi:lactoylglutathione lyase [Fluviicoccus keumensis]|uniref:Lactoylglutathione lyase n=1 Tax=Fluviicoccus keumensis TaxID=1435465 RepID=A0A4Q7ZDL2_9GAMM|nr:VOC family protein [Fluviicoccus keumensis]RZU47989.1 lactoylglutathione lyase [Fluviicoccus keumensis]